MNALGFQNVILLFIHVCEGGRDSHNLAVTLAYIVQLMDYFALMKLGSLYHNITVTDPSSRAITFKWEISLDPLQHPECHTVNRV